LNVNYLKQKIRAFPNSNGVTFKAEKQLGNDSIFVQVKPPNFWVGFL